MEFLVLRAVGGAPLGQLLLAHALHVVPGGAVLPFLRGRLIELRGEIDEQVVVQVHVPVDFQFLMSRRRGVVLPFVKKRGRLGDGDVVVKVEVT